MDFYITRHGQTDYNVAGFFQGCLLNPCLNECGKEQAVQVANKLYKAFGKDLSANVKIYSSPLRRAYQTAKTISVLFHKPVFIRDELIEGDFGIIDGMLEKEAKEKYSKEFTKWKDLDNLDFAFKNGESKGEIGERIFNYLRETVFYNGFGKYKHIIVTHSAAIRCLLLQCGIKEENIPFGNVYHFVSDGEQMIKLKEVF